MNRSHLSLAAALPFAIAVGGCFASNVVDPWEPPVVPPDPPPVTGALSVDDLAVTPDGTLITLAYDYASWDGGMIVQVLDQELAVVRSFELGQVYAMSIASLPGNRALVSDGSLSHTIIDLDTGALTTSAGFGDVANYPPGFLASDAGDFDDEDDDEVVNVPCENPGDIDGDGDDDWDMDVFDAEEGGEGTLLARVDLDGGTLGLSGTTDITSGGGLVYILGYERAVAVDAQTGQEVRSLDEVPVWDTYSWAYDATRNGLWIVSYEGTVSFLGL